jgi:hypothetical protein
MPQAGQGIEKTLLNGHDHAGRPAAANPVCSTAARINAAVSPRSFNNGVSNTAYLPVLLPVGLVVPRAADRTDLPLSSSQIVELADSNLL